MPSVSNGHQLFEIGDVTQHVLCPFFTYWEACHTFRNINQRTSQIYRSIVKEKPEYEVAWRLLKEAEVKAMKDIKAIQVSCPTDFPHVVKLVPQCIDLHKIDLSQVSVQDLTFLKDTPVKELTCSFSRSDRDLHMPCNKNGEKINLTVTHRPPLHKTDATSCSLGFKTPPKTLQLCKEKSTEEGGQKTGKTGYRRTPNNDGLPSLFQALHNPNMLYFDPSGESCTQEKTTPPPLVGERRGSTNKSGPKQRLILPPL